MSDARWWEIEKNTERYGKMATRYGDRTLTWGTKSQAIQLADDMTNYYSGCDYMFYVVEVMNERE